MFGEEKLHNVSRKRSNSSSPAGIWLLLPKISLILDHVLISSLPSGVGWPLKIAPESRDLRCHHGFHHQLSNCFSFLDLGKMRALDQMSLAMDSIWSVNNDPFWVAATGIVLRRILRRRGPFLRSDVGANVRSCSVHIGPCFLSF